MRKLVCDASVLIDLDAGGLTQAFFRLPYRFHVPIALYLAELSVRHSRLLQYGLRPDHLGDDVIREAAAQHGKHRGIDGNDSLVLALAKRKACPLLTGDRRLRAAAVREGVPVHGTLWVVERLLEAGLISSEQAGTAFERMKAAGSRLPWDRARASCRRATAARRGV